MEESTRVKGNRSMIKKNEGKKKEEKEKEAEGGKREK